MTRIINFIGGPGAGKSTTAAGVFYALKKLHVSCEFVGEYAKDVTWENTHALFENQLHIFSEQYRRQWRLLGKVDYVITDSPLILSCVYHPYGGHRPQYVEHAKRFFLDTFNQFDNTTFLVKHGVRPYKRIGRTQTQQEAAALHSAVVDFMLVNSLHFTEIHPEDEGVTHTLRALGFQ